MKFKRICCVAMAALMMISGMTVYATKASEIQSQKTQNEKALKDVRREQLSTIEKPYDICWHIHKQKSVKLRQKKFVNTCRIIRN